MTTITIIATHTLPKWWLKAKTKHVTEADSPVSKVSFSLFLSRLHRPCNWKSRPSLSPISLIWSIPSQAFRFETRTPGDEVNIRLSRFQNSLRFTTKKSIRDMQGNYITECVPNSIALAICVGVIVRGKRMCLHKLRTYCACWLALATRS